MKKYFKNLFDVISTIFMLVFVVLPLSIIGLVEDFEVKKNIKVK